MRRFNVRRSMLCCAVTLVAAQSINSPVRHTGLQRAAESSICMVALAVCRAEGSHSLFMGACPIDSLCGRGGKAALAGGFRQPAWLRPTAAYAGCCIGHPAGLRPAAAACLYSRKRRDCSIADIALPSQLRPLQIWPAARWSRVARFGSAVLHAPGLQRFRVAYPGKWAVSASATPGSGWRLRVAIRGSWSPCQCRLPLRQLRIAISRLHPAAQMR